jgi:predicted nucleic acid-binding protein
MVAAPELLVFELLATWRRQVRRGSLSAQRVAAAVRDLGDLRVVLFPLLPLRTRSWSLRDNLTAGDALFVALAELLDVPLATQDARLAAATRRHTEVPVIELEAPGQ